MKTFIPIFLFLFASCGSQSDQLKVEFNRILPDTSKTWAGRMTREAYLQTRTFEEILNLQKIINGTEQEEIRVWLFSSVYDQQVVFIAKPDSSNKWTLRTISFSRTKPDSIYADYTRVLRQSYVDSLQVNSVWQLTSQSNLTKGDSYGCLDGEDLLLEIANKKKYRLMWYRCPEINKAKDTAFFIASTLANRLDAFAVEH